MAERKTIKELVSDKLSEAEATKKREDEARAAVQKNADDAAARVFQRLTEVHSALKKHTSEVPQMAVEQVPTASPGATFLPVPHTINVRFGKSELQLTLESGGSSEVDCILNTKIQRAERHAYFKPDGTFVSIEFLSSGNGRRHPANAQGFLQFTMLHDTQGGNVPRKTEQTLDDFLFGAIEDLVRLAEVRAL